MSQREVCMPSVRKETICLVKEGAINDHMTLELNNQFDVQPIALPQ